MRRLALLRHPSPLFIWSATVVGLLTLLAVFAVIAWDFRKQTVIIAEQSAWNIATLINQAIARDIELYDYSMQAVIDGINDPEVMALSPRLKHAALFDRSATARGLGAMVVLNEQGIIVHDSPSIVPRAGNFSAREHFRVHKESSRDVGLYIGPPFRESLQDGGASISISRRIPTLDGSFRGIVSGTLKLEYLRERLGNLSVGAGGSITLFRNDGTVIVRNVDIAADESIGRNWKFLPLFDRLAENSGGLLRTHTSSDGSSRLYTYQTVGQLPLLVSVDLAEPDVLAPWWSKVRALALVYALMAASVVFLVWLFVSELKQRRAGERAEALRARHDVLTGLANRLGFEESLTREWRRAARDKTALSLVMFDVDQFKLYNDTHGHREGDKILTAIGAAIRHCVKRPADVAARYGGEELVVLMPDTDEAAATHVAEAVRLQIAALAIAHTKTDHGLVTVSGGVATFTPNGEITADDLVRRADAALYLAKCSGRNKIVASAFKIENHGAPVLSEVA